jgi:hypothetical protein
MLQHGRPMLEYGSMKQLFTFLKMPHLSKKHESDNSGWLITKYLYRQVIRKVVEVLAATRYVSITCDEVITMDNQSWISMHAYVIEDFYRKLILVSLD